MPSRYYLTSDVLDDPDAPVMIDKWGKVEVGTRVEYVGGVPLPGGPFILQELLDFKQFVVAIISAVDGKDYEVNPKNLTPFEG